MAGETIPPVTVEVAFDGGPYSSSYAWSDVTPWVSSFDVKRGRSYEVDRIEAGTLDLTLDNSDGRFTPEKKTIGKDLLGTGYKSVSTTDLTSLSLPWSPGSIPATPITPGKSYVFNRTCYTNGKQVIARVDWQWFNSSYSQISYVSGVDRWAVDSSQRAFTSTSTAPAGAVYLEVWVYVESAPEGKSGVTFARTKGEVFERAPYWPNVTPRRRVRVRTANLMPKDTSTGGDVSQTAANFEVSHVAGQTKAFTSSFSRAGVGSLQVGFAVAGDGVTAFNSSVRCGWVETQEWGYWTGTLTFSRTRLIPRGLARVVAGQTYTASGFYRMATTSTAANLAARIRWYKDDGTFHSASSAATITPVSGQWVYWTVTGVAGGAASSGVTLAGIELGTTGAASGVSGAVDCLQLEEGSAASTWTPGGSIFSGYVEKWPVKMNGLTSEISVSAVDGFNVLGTTELQRPVRQHILSSAPWGYWPLTEGAGASSAQNLADDTRPAVLRASKYGAATAAFGAASVVPNDDGTSWSLANIATNKGTVVDATNSGAYAFPTLADEFAVSFWCLPVRPASGNTASLFRATDAGGFRMVELSLDSSGYVTATVAFPNNGANPGGTSHSITSFETLSTSKGSVITLSVKAGNGLLTINDVAQGYTGDLDGPAVATQLRQPKFMTFGGNLGGTYAQDFANGRYGHLAIWSRSLLSEGDMSYYIGANDYGLYGIYRETEVERLSRVVKMAGYTGETVLDSPVSEILGFDWEEGTTALEVVQTSAEDASGYAFMDGDGRLTYHNRRRRQSGPLRYTLGEASGFPYLTDLEFLVDEDRVVNEVAFTRPGGAEGIIRDTASIAAYGRKKKSVTLHASTDQEVTNSSYWYVNRYANPVTRCDEVTLEATSCPALFPVVLGVEVGDKIRLADMAPQAATASMDFYVEAVRTSAVANGVTPEWVTVLSLSPASVADVWVMEDETLGILDDTAVLAW
ncbi:hypothetical protein ABZ725_41955 [Streptomyces sp. NPDC006872]|uniref:hypothetical protein n=1 Tax=Streptomyces sp. NPDC006872 TaxID=3155720 RepID=UPI0033F00722